MVDAGFEVTVICPTGANRDREREVVIEGVRILRYPLRTATGGLLGYLREYTVALWHTLRLAIRSAAQAVSTSCMHATRRICCS